MPTIGRLTMSDAEIDRIMQTGTVRRTLARVADRVAVNARSIAATAGMPNLPITRVDGIRPGGRPYARVQAPLAPEFGTGRVTRLAILGQAVARR